MVSVSDKKLNQDDFDDLNDIDVPTYDSASGTSQEVHKTEQLDRRDIYSAAGRTAPQTIEPSKQESSRLGGFGRKKAAPAGAAGAAGTGAATGSAATGPAATEAMDRPKEFQTQNLRALDEDDTPRGKYDESQDFATRPAATGTGAEPAGSVDSTAMGAGAFGPDYTSNGEFRDADADADAKAVKVKDHRRGTIDFGLLIARLVVGVLLIVDAVAVLFKLGGNAGVTGLEGEFGSYFYANILAWGVPSVELVVGVLLIFGLATPIAACLGMIVAMFMALHSFNQQGSLNVFNLSADVQYWLAMSGFLVALQFTGPGYYGLDFGRGWARRPLASSWILAVVGFAAAAALWYFAARTNPFN